MGSYFFCSVFTSKLILYQKDSHQNTYVQAMKNAATPFFTELKSFPDSICEKNCASILFSSSIHTWQLHQQPHPLPLLSWARHFNSLCPLFARNKNICSVKCFCKWLNSLMGRQAAGVQTVWSWITGRFQFCHSLNSLRKTWITPVTHVSRIHVGSSTKPTSAPMACGPSPLNPELLST